MQDLLSLKTNMLFGDHMVVNMLVSKSGYFVRAVGVFLLLFILGVLLVASSLLHLSYLLSLAVLKRLKKFYCEPEIDFYVRDSVTNNSTPQQPSPEEERAKLDMQLAQNRASQEEMARRRREIQIRAIEARMAVSPVKESSSEEEPEEEPEETSSSEQSEESSSDDESDMEIVGVDHSVELPGYSTAVASYQHKSIETKVEVSVVKKTTVQMSSARTSAAITAIEI